MLSEYRDIAEDIWNKVGKCKSMGGSEGITKVLSNLNMISKKNEDILNNLKEQLKKEEDKRLKTLYGAKWKRVGNKTLNANKKKQVSYYEGIYKEAKDSDNLLRFYIELLQSLCFR